MEQSGNTSSYLRICKKDPSTMMVAPKTEDYHLLGDVLDQGLKELGYSWEDLNVEPFASAKQHVLDLFCSKRKNCCYKFYWPSFGMAYGNPRFSKLGRFLTKTALERSRMDLCSPDRGAHGGNEYWCTLLDKLMLTSIQLPDHAIYVPSCCMTFIGRPGWGIMLSMVDRSPAPVPWEHLDPAMVQEIQCERSGYTLDVLKNQLRPRDAVQTTHGGDEYAVSDTVAPNSPCGVPNALTHTPSGPASKNPLAFPTQAQPSGCLPAGFRWIAVADSVALLSTTPHPSQAGVPTRLPDVLGSRPPAASGRGGPFPLSPRSLSRVSLCVLRPLIRGPQGPPSSLRTPHGRPTVQGISPTSCGQGPHGWPMVPQSMATCFPLPRGLLLGAFCPPIFLLSFCLQPLDVPLCFATSHHWPSLRAPPLIPCLYSSGMPETQWRGPTGCSSIRGPFRALCTGCSYPIPLRFFRTRFPIRRGCLRSLPQPFPGPVTASHPATRVNTPPGCHQPPGRPVS